MNFSPDPSLTQYNQLTKQIAELYHKIAVQLHLSDSAFLVFYSILSLGNECSQKDICDFICLNKQTVNSSVLKLQKEGYLHLCAGHGREMHITLTARGKEIMQEKILPIAEAENAVFQALSRQERDALIAATEKYLLLMRAQCHTIFATSAEMTPPHTNPQESKGEQ